MSAPPDDRDALKRAAAAQAVQQVESGMVVGLGTGSTAAFAVAALAARVAAGLRIAAIPTSERVAALARRLGLPLTDFAAHRRIDLTIDGADQVERGTLGLIKGRGGALLREKIVASASARVIIIVDETKLANRLGGATPLPVEIARFGWQPVLDRLAALGCAPRLRRDAGEPFVSDNGNLIADCDFAEIADAAALEARLAAIVGVVESGLFIDLASAVMVGRPAGVEVLAR
ncbi:MAG: ribose-5-phosphate isomerase RpiA [Stellaceae bacterium]